MSKLRAVIGDAFIVKNQISAKAKKSLATFLDGDTISYNIKVLEGEEFAQALRILSEEAAVTVTTENEAEL